MNLDVKSNLAKLLATENITIQHNKVSTASFDVKNRVLTLPIFKQKSGDVYDMLIAHECAHALWTPWEEWDGIDIDELRSYVNVLEDTRIDKMIQSKYPGVVKNYQNGFDILEKQNFFGIDGKNINKDLMLIDKINLRSKSMNRLPFDFNAEENEWLDRVDGLSTFKQVLRLAKELLVWQKQQVEQMQKLPNFDESQMAMSYGLQDDDYDDEANDEEFENGQGSGSDTKENPDEADEKNDFNNFGDQKADDEKDSNQGSSNGQGDTKHEDKKESQGEADRYAKGQGGFATKPAKKLKAITDDSFQESIVDELVDRGNKGYNYGRIPKANIDDKLSCLTGYKNFLKDMRAYKVEQRQYYNISRYSQWLENSYKSFMKDNKKTVMYLVKEFEMKKAATAYKRAQTDKTGIIDPLKLKDYQFSDDIFKRLTVLPNGKNHGMIMLLDWSGSMSDVLFNTVKQLINLVEFVRKVNIPFEVYFFTSERDLSERDNLKGFHYKNGDWMFENFHLVNCASHRMAKRELDEALMTLYHMGAYYDYNYTYRRSWDDQDSIGKYDNYGIPHKYSLGNTPLNESLIYMLDMIPMFQKKYGIEKTTFITLTDGASNYHRDHICGMDQRADYDKTNVYQIGKKKYVPKGSRNFTACLLSHIKNELDCNVIGFYILKRVKRWDIERYIKDYKDYHDKHVKFTQMRKEMTTNKALAVDAEGYDKYFILDGKKLNVENFDMNEAQVKKGTASELKRIFGKSMANRLVSRVVLNKFIKEVA